MKWLRRLVGVSIGVLLLGLLAWLALPPLLKSQAETRLGLALGRSVTLGEVGFKPWTLELTLRDLVIGPAAGQPAGEPLLRLARLHVDAAVSSLLRRAPVIEAIELDGLQLHVARIAAGRYDIDDLIAKFTPAAKDDTPSEPTRFALYNLQVRDASLSFDDRPVQRRHRVQALTLTLPFLSNLPAQVDVKVEPRLAFTFNGTPFDTGAAATPFARNRNASLTLKSGELDLLPYLGYLPEGLPLRLTRGRVAADLALEFELPEGKAPRVALRGDVSASEVALADVSGAPLLQWQRVALGLRDVQPLARELAFGALTIAGPQLHITRDRDGRLNLMRLAAPGATPAERIAAAASAASGPAAAHAADTNPWRISLDTLNVSALRVLWDDAAVQPAAAMLLDDASIQAGPLKLPWAAAVPVKLAAALRPQPAASGAAAADWGRVQIEGQGRDTEALLKLDLDALALRPLAPYLAPFLTPSLDGSVSAQAQIDWAAAAGGKPQRLKFSQLNASVDALRVVDAGVTAAAGAAAPGKAAKRAVPVPPAMAWKQLSLQGGDIDVEARSVALGSVKLVQPAALLVRDGAGQWAMQRWLPAAAQAPASAAAVPAARSAAHAAAPPSGKPSAAAAAPWRIGLRELLVEGGQLHVSDAFAAGAAGTAPVQAVQFDVTALRLAMQNLALVGERSTVPARLQLSARLGAPGLLKERPQAAASLAWRGQVGLQPLALRGQLALERLPLPLFEPYVGHHLKLGLVRADAGLKADVSLLQTAAGIKLDAKGDAVLADVLVQSRPEVGAALNAGDDLLSWQAFTLKGVTLALAPAQRPRVEIAEAALSDFYSRLVIAEQGRFNLQDVAAGEPAAPAPVEAASSAAAAASAAPVPAAAAAAAAASAASAASTASATSDPPIDIAVSSTRLQRGSIDFTDRFVRPNYSAKLTELDGTLGTFRSGTREMASLALRGRAAGTALLDIAGQINPTAQPLALDIRARATDLELAPLSPYAGKYAGYAIERGKLSMDVSYKIDADGTLNAKNQVTLNQLTFGDKIDSPSATKLPVLLAVALLKDRHGVIDINLPVSGSVNDPKFSVGGIIWKVILNLLVKALTAPFALLSGGGGDDLSLVEFVPGTSRVSEAGAAAIDKVAKALAERPALKMTVTGAGDPVAEREAFQRAALEARLLAERQKERVRAGAAVDVDAAVTMTAEERQRVLKEVYRQTELPDKPRNLLGMAKDLPPAEMEARLLPRTVVNDDVMRELALQRGLAVRDALIAKGLASERLFLAAPKLHAAGDALAAASAASSPGAAASAVESAMTSAGSAGAWTPRVQLTLSTQ